MEGIIKNQGHARPCFPLVLPSPRVYTAHNDLSSFFIYYLMSIVRLWKIPRNFFLLVRVISISLSLSLLHSHLREGEKYNMLDGSLICLPIVGFPKFPKSKNPWFWNSLGKETERAASFKIRSAHINKTEKNT